MNAGFVVSYGVLCFTQAALAAAPIDRTCHRRFGISGFLLPAVCLCLGVALLRTFTAGPTTLALLATSAAPLLAASLGRMLGWPRWWLTPAAAVALYLVAWQVTSPVGEAAGVVLIGLACLALAAMLAALSPRWSIQVGLVLLALVDTILVWCSPQVGPATTTLDRASLPILSLPFLPSHQLPALQDATFGNALMGWLDLLAPALLATTLTLRQRRHVAIAVGLGAGAWGLLLVVTPILPATVPIAAASAAVLLPGGGRVKLVRFRRDLRRREGTEFSMS